MVNRVLLIGNRRPSGSPPGSPARRGRGAASIRACSRRSAMIPSDRNPATTSRASAIRAMMDAALPPGVSSVSAGANLPSCLPAVAHAHSLPPVPPCRQPHLVSPLLRFCTKVRRSIPRFSRGISHFPLRPVALSFAFSRNTGCRGVEECMPRDHHPQQTPIPTGDSLPPLCSQPSQPRLAALVVSRPGPSRPDRECNRMHQNATECNPVQPDATPMQRPVHKEKIPLTHCPASSWSARPQPPCNQMQLKKACLLHPARPLTIEPMTRLRTTDN